jgi:hypothetical protein
VHHPAIVARPPLVVGSISGIVLSMSRSETRR